MAKIGLELQITSDATAFKAGLARTLLEVSKTSNVDIPFELKADPAEIDKTFKMIQTMAEKRLGLIQKSANDLDLDGLEKKIASSINDLVNKYEKAFKQMEGFAEKTGDQIKRELKDAFTPIDGDTTNSRAGKAMLDQLDKLVGKTKRASAEYTDLRNAVTATHDKLAMGQASMKGLNLEMQQFADFATKASNGTKMFAAEVARSFDGISEQTTHVATGMAKEFNHATTSMINQMKKMRNESKKGLVDTSDAMREVVQLENSIYAMKKTLAGGIGSMTTQQVSHMNKAIENGQRKLDTIRNDIRAVEDRNSTHTSQSAIRARQTKTWDKITRIDDNFSNAKEQMTSGKASNINLRSLAGQLGNLTKYSNELERAQLEAEGLGDVSRAQAIQQLHTAVNSKIRAHKQTYGAMANRFGSYEDAVRGQLSTKQATDAAVVLNNRKGSFAHAALMQGQGQVLDAATMSQLANYGANLSDTQTILKNKLRAKSGSQEELEEVKRYLKLIEAEQEKHRLDMERIAHKQAKNELKIQKDKDAEELREQKAANARKYADMVAHLTKNEHLIAAMSTAELRDTRSMLKGARVAMAGDPDSIVAISSLQDSVGSQLRAGDKPGFADTIKKKLGFGGGGGGPFNNKRLNAFHGLNHRITNVSQMMGTSLYGMGAAGLGSAIIGGTIEKAAELDTAKLTIAGMVNTYSQFIDAQGKSVTNAENLNKSLQYSDVLYGKLRDAAKSSLMTTGEITEGFLTGAPRLREKGFSDEQAIEITKKIMMLGRATGLSSTAIMSDIRDFAAGNVNTRSQVLMTAGINKDQLKNAFATGGSDAAFKYFQERMASFDATFKKIADTPAGQLNAFKIEVEQLSQTMGEKLAPILIPQLQKFRQLISDWAASGEAERFITSFGKFVEMIAESAMKFMNFMRPWLSDFNSLMTVTIIGIFTTMAAKMTLQAVAMSNPVTAIVALVGALVAGLLAQQARLENTADAHMSKLLENENYMNSDVAKTDTRRAVIASLKSGNYDSLSKAESYYASNAKDLKVAAPFIRAFMEDEKERRGGSLLDKGGAMFLDSMYNLAGTAANPDYKGLMTDAQLNAIAKKTGFAVGSPEFIAAAEATKRLRNVNGMNDDERFELLTKGQLYSKGGLQDFKSQVNSLRGKAMKNLGYRIGRNSDLTPENERAINAEIARLMDENDFKAVNKPQAPDVVPEKKVSVGRQGPRLTTLEDVLRTYARGQNEILQQRIGNTSDVAMSGGQYLKPMLLGRGLSAGVTQAVATWQESVVANREKGPYALAEANAQLTNTLEQLRNSFLENIRTVAANIETQKQQNRVMRDNISLQEKANQLENAKFGLSQMKPFDIASGAAYVTKAIGVANMQRNYSIAQATVGVSQSTSDLAIANIKYLDEQGLLNTLPADQQSIYRRAMSGDTSAIGKLPPGILSQNLRQFSTGAEVSGSIAQANRGSGSSVVGSASQWKSSIKGLAKGMGLSVSSEYRPGARTHAKGSASWHSKSEGKEHGLAIDFAGTKKQMASFFDAVRATYGDGAIRELIYTPKGAVFSGKYVRTFNPITMKDHYDHVHVALKGGKSVDMKAVEAKMPSQDRGEGAMSDAISGINPATGMPVGPYQSESMPPMLSEWFAMNGQLAGLKADGAIQAANNEATSQYQQAFNTGIESYSALMQFEAQQRLGLIGLSGNGLADRLRINKADTAIFEAQNKAGQYMLARQQGMGAALEGAFPGGTSDAPYNETYVKQFIEGYLTDSVKGFGDIVNPAAESKARIEDGINRKNEYLTNMQQVIEKAASNLEQLANIDFNQFVQFVQNPYARIGSVVNPGQALVERTQRTMDKAIADSDLAVDKEEMVMKGLGLYNQIIAKDPSYFLNKRRAGRTRAQQAAGAAMGSQAVSAAFAGAMGGVGTNFLNTNLYGALTGNQNFDIAGVLAPLTGLGSSKFDQSADILVGLANGTLDTNELAKNPAFAKFFGYGMGPFDKKGLKKYAMDNMLGKIGGNLAGNYIGNQVFAGKDPAAISTGTDIGGMLASAGTFGSKFMGPAGIIAGSVFGGLIGGLFGGKKANPDEERFRERQRQHFDKMEKMAEETNKLLRPSYDVYNTIKGDMLYGSASRFYSNRAYSPLGNQLTTGAS